MIRRAIAFALVVAATAVVVPLIGSAPDVNAAGMLAGRVRRTFQPNKGKIYIAVIGNDARHGNPNKVRADALHIIGINTKTMRGGILNFPRDSYVNIPGRGSGRINEALYRGGPRLQVKTLEAVTGIKIDYWIMTGFEGFKDIIYSVGPVPYRITRNIFDPGGSGARIKAGTKRLGAETALQFVRTRKAFGNGDIARTTNQARFLRALLRHFRDKVDRNPATLLKWMTVARRKTRFDMSAAEMFRLGVLATQLSTKRVGMATVPVSYGSVGSASVVFIRPGARQIYKRFRKTATL